LLACCSLFTSISAQSLTKLWETDTLLRTPESVLLDAATGTLYVSNIGTKTDTKDGDGFISVMTTDGKIKNLEWAKGLDDPKGMGLFKNTLYVADLSRVIVIDTKTGKITQSIDIEGSQFLNDVTVDSKGNVYISDSATGKIHLITGNKASLYFESPEFKRINGLLATKEALYVADAGNGAFYKVTWDKKLTKSGDTGPGADGIVPVGKNEHIVSCWGGEVYFVNASGASQKMLDTKEQKINSADIDYDAKTKTVFIPTFFANTVVAYRFAR